MQLVRPSAQIEVYTPNAELLLEACARTCYQSEGKADGTLAGARTFLLKIIQRGHESVLEHASVTVRFVCDRGVSHELVRHRIASFSQESTRYCNYGAGPNGCTFVIPPWIEGDIDTSATERVPKGPVAIWYSQLQSAESAYLQLLERGWSPQQARTVLPNSLKTQIVMTANMREWRHFFKLRAAKAAHPQMQELAYPLLHRFDSLWPSLFSDLTSEFHIANPVKAPHIPLSGEVRNWTANQAVPVRNPVSATKADG